MTRPAAPIDPSRPDFLEELPPMDDGEDEDQDLPEDENFGLPQLEHDEEEDDAESDEFETGVVVSEPRDVEDQEEPFELGLRLEALLDLDDATEPEGDEDGAVDVGAIFGVEPFPEVVVDAGEDGPGERLDDSLEGDLPELDDDDDGGVEEEEFELPAANRDDAPLPWASLRWEAQRVAGIESPCTALAVGLGVVAAAGEEVFWLEGSAERPTRLAAAQSRVESVALVGQTKPVVLCSTPSRGLLRIRADASTAEELRGWREAAGVRADEPTRLRVCQLTEDCPHVLMALTGRGQLLRSQDGGVSFMRLDLGEAVLALSPRGTPLLALIAGQRSPALAWSDDLGVSWNLVDLDAAARDVAIGRAPLVAAFDSVFVIADRDRGLVVSGDRGRSFTRVPGCADATALAAGMLGGRAAVWAALYREARGASEIAEIDPATPEASRIAFLTENGDGDEELDRWRVHAMSWDSGACRLWLAGEFGLTSVAPLRS